MRNVVAALVLACVAFGGFAFGKTASVEEALSAYRKNRIAEAKADFAAVVADSAASTRDRAVARRELARIAWLIDADPAAARAQLESTDARKDETCQSAALLVRVLRESGQPAKAVQSAARLGAQCTEGRDVLIVQESRAWADLAIERRGSSRSRALTKMKSGLDGLTADGRRGLAGSQLNIELGLLSSTPERAFDGWQSYFWLTKEEAPPALLKDFRDARKLFRRALAPDADLKDEIELLRMLVRAGFCREAERFATLHSTAQKAKTARASDWSSIEAYFRFRHAVDRLTLNHYRRVAHGNDDAQAYRTEITKLIDQTAAKLAAQVNTDNASAKDVLRRAWGLHFTIGLTGGYMSLHLGHVIENTRENIEQHGRTGAVERIVLENMLSNGYEGWLWDGWAQAGGWAESGERLIQVRTSYVGSVFTALGLRPGRPARASADEKLVALQKREDEILQTKQLADLPGLAERLRFQTIDQIVGDMKSAGEDDDNAFQGRYWRALIGATITIHEGRHVLDQMQYTGEQALSSEELEYRAKLSELQFGEYPRLSLSKMVNGQIGGESNHGKANTRILKEIGIWISENAATVEGFNSNKPVLLQIDKLNDRQFRVFACSRDPACQKR
jgi:hypothetical protein